MEAVPEIGQLVTLAGQLKTVTSEVA